MANCRQPGFAAGRSGVALAAGQKPRGVRNRVRRGNQDRGVHAVTGASRVAASLRWRSGSRSGVARPLTLRRRREGSLVWSTTQQRPRPCRGTGRCRSGRLKAGPLHPPCRSITRYEYRRECDAATAAECAGPGRHPCRPRKDALLVSRHPSWTDQGTGLSRCLQEFLCRHRPEQLLQRREPESPRQTEQLVKSRVPPALLELPHIGAIDAGALSKNVVSPPVSNSKFPDSGA